MLKQRIGVNDMSGLTKLWIDDIRPIPPNLLETGEWQCSRTAWEALTKLDLINFEEVSLDHDLASFIGNKEITGNDILVWLIQRKMDGKYVPPVIRIHSANPVGVQNMESLIKRYL